MHLWRGKKALLARLATHYTAFTLAEVLITLGIIGVVASMTIPTLMTNVSNRQFETGAKKTEATLIQALLMMKANKALVGHETTENFVNELQNYLKIAKTCEAGSLSGCYPEEFTTGDETMHLSDITTATSLGHEDWGTNVEGFVLNNGTSFLTAYNPACSENDYKNCAAFVYDMNSVDKNNRFTGANGESDLGVYNGAFTKFTLCTWDGYYDVFNCSSGVDVEAYLNENRAELDQICRDDGTFEYAFIVHNGYGEPRLACRCIAVGTPITLADGSHKAIEDISYDDDLLVWDFDNGRMTKHKMTVGNFYRASYSK